ncbi:hypothetical protein D3C75_1092970 [compost metagenome]
MVITKPPIPGTRNKGRISGSKSEPKKWTMPKPSISSASTRNGNREGKSTSHQIRMPRMEALITSLG